MEARFFRLKILFFTISIIFISCSREPNDIEVTGDLYNNNIKGQVVNLNLEPLAGVSVQTSWMNTTTDQSGYFNFTSSKPFSDRIIINFQKEGYFEEVRGFTLDSNCTNYMKIALLEKKLLGDIDNNSGGELNGNGLKLIFDKNSFYGSDGKLISGKVNIYANSLNPDNPNFGIGMAGGDFRAIDLQNGNGALYSYGFFKIEAKTTDGKFVQLKRNYAVQIEIPLSFLNEAPDTISTWVLGGDGIWRETMFAVKRGNYYFLYSDIQGSVNCDYFSRLAYVKGKLCENNNPVINEPVKIGQVTSFTNSNGIYSALVPSNAQINVKCRLGNYTINSINPGGAAVVDFGECNICDRSSFGDSYLYAEGPGGVISDLTITNAKKDNNIIISAKSEYKSMQANLTLKINNYIGLGIYTLSGELILSNSTCTWGYSSDNGSMNLFSLLDDITCGKFVIDLKYSRYLSACGENSDLGSSIKLNNGRIILKIK
jgi:hypothetical protein